MNLWEKMYEIHSKMRLSKFFMRCTITIVQRIKTFRELNLWEKMSEIHLKTRLSKVFMRCTVDGYYRNKKLPVLMKTKISYINI